jgi:23S rRNA (cytidine1920-2'-O)/16S rRNA (cytidine1409-2'-O)-methyltransferase
MPEYVSRGGQKLEHALREFAVDVRGKICADLGSNTGGFVDCLLQHGAEKVFAVDTGYGVLDWNLRQDSRVVVMERTNAMHVELPLPMPIITIDVGWTRQKRILPSALRLLDPGGLVITLIKPQYESQASRLRDGILPPDQLELVLDQVCTGITSSGFIIQKMTPSPIKGSGGNTEYLALLEPNKSSAAPRI